jgi:hypothetical protein
VQIECILDLRPHGISPRFGATHSNLDRAPPGIEALSVKFVEDREHVAWRDEDDIWLEIGDQAHLSLGHAAGNRHNRHAEPLGTIMKADPAGEQAVAV